MRPSYTPASPSLSQAIAYLRVSTEDQRLGPLAQRQAIEAYAAREHIEILAWHTDQGVSGAAPIADRPALTLAIAQARKACANLIVAKRDRLARDTMIAAMIDRSLTRGSRVLSADGTGNGQQPADQFMRTILDGAAEYERALIRSRTKAALSALRASGMRAGTVPYGYQADASGKLTAHDDELRTVERIRELRAQGTGGRQIARTLQAEGYVGRSGRPLLSTQVYRILAAA